MKKRFTRLSSFLAFSIAFLLFFSGCSALPDTVSWLRKKIGLGAGQEQTNSGDAGELTGPMHAGFALSPGDWHVSPDFAPEVDNAEISDSQGSGHGELGVGALTAEEVLADTAVTLIRNRQDHGYYFGLLSEDGKHIYEAIRALARYPDNTERRIVVRLFVAPESEAFKAEYHTAYQALLFDHAELFWAYRSGIHLTYQYYPDSEADGSYQMYFHLSEPYSLYQEEMTLFNRAVDEFMIGIDLKQPQPYVALQIHDQLIGLVTYNHDLRSQDDRLDNGCTAYGALVADSNGVPHSAVCDGYAFAYEYLLQQAGIECTYIRGMAGATGQDSGRHAWNAVRLEEDWYEVDATWDDFDKEPSEDGELSEIEEEALADDRFMGLLKHRLYNLTTAGMTEYNSGEELRYVADGGWITYQMSSYHIRYTPETTDNAGDLLTARAPVAEGTKYRYDYFLNGGE